MAAVIFFGAVSCAKEDISSSLAGGEVEVTFTANLPELGTRAYGDGLNANLLRCWVYDANGSTEDKHLFYKEVEQAVEGSRTFTFTLPLIKGMTYNFVLWADKDGLYNVEDGIVTVDYTEAKVKANDNNRDAFYGFESFDPLKDTPKFTLIRPFAQLNAATSENMEDIEANGLTLATSSIKAKVYTQFDIKACDVVDSSLTEVTLAAEVMPYLPIDPATGNHANKLPGKETYTYLAMGYLLAPQDGMVSDVTFCFNGKKGGKDFTVGGDKGLSYTNVPLKQNYRTNILGQLLTKSTEIEVEILPDFGGADQDITVNTVSNAEELKNAIIRGGYIEFANDITVDKWIMFSETLTTSDSSIITIDKIDVNIDGKGHTLTVKDFERTGNGGRLFYNASNLNIANLNIKYPEGATFGGLYFQSGVIKDVNFISGGVAIAPGSGNIKVENCTFATNDTAIYFEKECDNLTVTGCTFNQPDVKNVILLRGDVKFTDNIINSGRTVNIVSGSPVVTGNNFNDVRLKVYAAATATVANNTINTLEFEKNYHSSTFTNNTLSAAAQAALDAVTPSVVSTSAELVAALQTAVAAGETNIVFDAKGANIGNFNKDDNTWFTTNLVPTGVTVTLRNATVSGISRWNNANGTLIFENCTFTNNSAYSINFGWGNGHVKFTKCKLYGWCSFSGVTVEMNDCNIAGNGSYALVRSYNTFTMNNCTIDGSYAIKDDDYPDGVSIGDGAVLTMTGCTMTDAEYDYGESLIDGNRVVDYGENSSYIIVDGKRLVCNPSSLEYALKNGNAILMENNITVEAHLTNTSHGTNINIDGGGNELTLRGIYGVSGANVSLSNMTLVDSKTDDYTIFNQGGKIELNNVTYNSTINKAFQMAGGGDVVLTDCKISGDVTGTYSASNIWCGDGRNVTVNGGTYGSIFMNAQYHSGWPAASAHAASKITLNDGTITKLTLETELGAEGYYVSATLTQNGGTITNLVENPQNLDLTGRSQYNK